MLIITSRLVSLETSSPVQYRGAQATVIISPRLEIEKSWNPGEPAPAARFSVETPADDRSEIFLFLVALTRAARTV